MNMFDTLRDTRVEDLITGLLESQRDARLPSTCIYKHHIHTPFALCDEILAKVQHSSDLKYLVMFNLEFLYSLSKFFDFKENRVYYYTTDRAKARLAQMLFPKIQILDKLEDGMEFHVIVGNPPYQNAKDGEKRDSAANLWPSFVAKAESMTAVGGYFAFITPNGWITPSADIGKGKSGIRIYDYISRYHTIELNVEECKRHFSVGSSFTYFVINKIENTENLDTHIVTRDRDFYHCIRNVRYCPSDLSEISLSLNEKVLNGIPLGFTNNNTADSKKFTADISDIETDIHKTKCYHSSAGKGTYCYSSYSGQENRAPKVMVCSSGNYLPIFDGGSLGFTNKIYVYYLQENESLLSLQQYLESKLVLAILDQNKTSGWVSYALRLLPRIDLTRPWTDKELYDHFGLTEEERLHIDPSYKA